MLEVFYFVLLFRMAGKCWVIKLKRFVGYRSRFYWQATVSLVASIKDLLLLVAVCMVEKCSATGTKTSSYRTYATFREKVVCRKCWRMLINKTVIVKGVCYIFLNC